ncbi:MAG: isopentenyl-diphosphate Delta-isomerase [Chitinophagaceae bacterium]|jgi:isopentenyl-diphosphate delta-isomerase|nr:isopentenyl-diphosphate Delta-isomerase [Chitinophagaceae bacterium]
MEQVILVDENDQQVGLMEKMAAHEQALLHRAFSVFIFNSEGKMLLQQRALSKYHSGGLWTNACCSHPRPNEAVEHAATRRLNEELGFNTPIIPAFQFTYKAAFDNGLTEHEFDHVFVGKYDGEIHLNIEEAENYGFGLVEDIETDIQQNPTNYTEWFKIAFPKVKAWIQQNNYINA